MRPFLRSALSAAATVVTVVIAAVALAITLLPQVLGAIPLTVLTGSMSPTHRPGDIVVVQPTNPAAIRIGDVITFQPVSDDPELITHRVVGISARGDRIVSFTTRGDANGAADKPIIPDQVKGRVLYAVPLVGYLKQSSWALPTLIGSAIVALMVLGVRSSLHRNALRGAEA